MSVSKMIMGQAANQYVAPTYVENVFSTYLYDGTGATQTITNNIDLSGEGGLVWIKRRDGVDGAGLFDTVRGATKGNFPSSTSAELTDVNSLTSFNSDGFTLGTGYTNFAVNGNNMEHVAWTWRKAPKFFDVGTISFNSSGVGSYSHNLGVIPAMVIFKLTNTTGDWFVWHKDLTSQNYAMFLNSTAASSNQGGWATYTDTTVTFDSGIFANDTAVVYLFAHNDGDGDFGLTNDQDIIKCGSYTGNGSTTGPVIDLGFEPQWVMLKRTDSADEWFMYDVMRGFDYSTTARLSADSSSAESPSLSVVPTSTGFQPVISHGSVNASGGTYIYMAIRRGPMATPTSATDVFAIDTYGGTAPTPPLWNSGFPTDMAFYKHKGNTTDFVIGSRLTGTKHLKTNADSAEATLANLKWDFQNGYFDATGTISDYVSWMWKRAPSFFDVVAYSGTGNARTINHNLGVAPEMIWIKSRANTNSWSVYYGDNTDFLILNDTAATADDSRYWNDTSPTSTVFSVGTENNTNQSGIDFIAYLFATVAGVSKVGSYTGNGSSSGPTVDCGFSGGPRFVLIKRTDDTANWFVMDSVRGITAGNDPLLALNLNSAEQTADYIDPTSSGFQLVTTASVLNANGASYIFYAIA